MEFLNEKTYVDQADKVISKLKQDTLADKRKKLITTSKIRNILSMSADIYNVISLNNEKTIDDESRSRIDYLRIRMVYESGRERAVEDFMRETKLLDYVKMIGTDKQRYVLFFHYLEALVAYHRFYGGKDN